MVGEILKFLSKNGQEAIRFDTEDGEPDIHKARECALALRERIGDTNLVQVSQRVNVVRIRMPESVA